MVPKVSHILCFPLSVLFEVADNLCVASDVVVAVRDSDCAGYGSERVRRWRCSRRDIVQDDRSLEKTRNAVLSRSRGLPGCLGGEVCLCHGVAQAGVRSAASL